MRTASLFLLLLLITNRLTAQTTPEPFAADWKILDSLIAYDLPKSAEKKAQQVYQKAGTANQPVQQLKAQLYLLYALQAGGATDSPQRALALAEAEARTQPFPIRNIWHSYAGELYQRYFQENSWRIRQRTAQASADSSAAGITEWSADRILRAATDHYRASLQNANGLIGIKIAAYQPIVIPGENSDGLRPTLYDLLAFRAMDHFESGYGSLTRPADVFAIDNARYFGTPADFIDLKIVTTDSTSQEAQSLRIYQQLLRLHQGDNNPAALIDAELHRLEFVYNHASLANKEPLYEKALLALAEGKKGNPGVAEALFRVQQLRYYRTQRMPGNEDPVPEPVSLARIKASLEAIIREYPGSEGAGHAGQVLHEITRITINVQAEEVVLPGEPSKVLLRYKNVGTAHFRLMKLSGKLFQKIKPYNIDSLTRARISRLDPLLQWQQALPASGDYGDHSTEIKVDALPVGCYALMVSAGADWQSDSATVSIVVFQVSRLSVVTLSGSAGKTDGVVADRKTGAPVTGAAIRLERDNYNPKTKKTEVKFYATVSGTDGAFGVAGSNYYQRMMVVSRGDTLLDEGSFSYRQNDDEEAADAEEADTTVWYFTDRAIYRPGQEIFFKGIAFRTLNGKSRVIPGYRSSVLLNDANGVQVDSVAVTTNDFGSFHGYFRLPTGSLTGAWSIEDGDVNDQQEIQVEEYKRPRFEVKWDTLAGTYRLNENVTVRGTAQAFSGANIDGAQVKFKVTRQAEYPWYGWGNSRYRYSPSQEIASGTATSNAQGRFNVSFTTKAPEPPDTFAVYRYEVSADVTDAAGETRSGEVVVLRAGYRNLIVSTSLAQYARLRDLDSFKVVTTNLNGIFQPADITVRVEALQAPATPLRKRRWNLPDQFVMDSVTFKRHFPNDEYRDESNPEKWPRRPLYITTKRTRRDGRFGLPRKEFTSAGTYHFIITGRDSSGKIVERELYIKLQDAAFPQIVGEPLSLLVNTASPVAGQRVEAAISTGFASANLFRMVKSKTTESLSTQSIRQGKNASWNIAALSPKEQEVQLLLWTIRDNRFYEAEETVSLQSASKNLKISWATHRDKLQPGAEESWTMTVKGVAGDKVAAEMVAALYDGSLDQFKQHGWFPRIDTKNYLDGISLQPQGMSTQEGGGYHFGYRYRNSEKQIRYPALWSLSNELPPMAMGDSTLLFSTMSQQREYEGGVFRANTYFALGSATIRAQGAFEASAAPGYKNVEPLYWLNPLDHSYNELSNPRHMILPDPVLPDADGDGKPDAAPVTPRKNLRETAFFFPDLRTDDSGNIVLRFTMPEALTQWRLLAFAHTADLRTGSLEGTVRTQKDLMVIPGIPRFLRQGDAINITAKLANLADHALTGTAKIEILDAATMQPLNLPFRLTATEQPFTAATAGSTSVSWNVTVPTARYEPVVIRITARSGLFTDGEDNTLPVLTNRTLVTETQSLWLNGNGTKSITFAPLAMMNRAVISPSGRPRGAQSDGEQTSSIAPHALTIEYTTNPAWLALQSLPYLADYPYECAEQTFNRYYANALAAHILAEAPKLKAIFARWQSEDTAAVLSKLELNPELKSALLEETPWVLDAANEREQRGNIAKLFNASRAASASASTLRKLRDMQSGDGSFPWFKGGSADRYITQYIAIGLARMQKLDVKLSKEGNDILASAQHYLDMQLVADYRQAIKIKSGENVQHIGPLQAQWLYGNSLQPRKTDTATSAARRFFMKEAGQYWNTFNAYTKAMVAMTLRNESGSSTTTGTILQSLRETAIRSEEQGVYWIRPGAGYYWYESPIEAQALLIECFAAAGDSTMVGDAKRWLLKQKQTQHWATTKATADACYALLLTGADWTRSTPQVSIRLGDYTINSASEKSEAGTGYFKRNIPREQITAAMSNITVEVKGSSTQQPSWGAVYYQYFADMDAIRSSIDSSRPKSPLAVKKQFFTVRNTKSGEVLEAITEQSPLKVGDKVRVRVVLTADRDMDYVHLKDSRASCLEPVDVLSGYRWQDGLGYYQTTRDASSNFFIDHLRKGTAVFEYTLFVTSKGDFGAGLATAQCMYAPEFAAHSQGMRIIVR